MIESAVSRHEVVAAAAVKKFRDMILTYNGPKTYEKLREYLLRKVDEENLARPDFSRNSKLHLKPKNILRASKPYSVGGF